MKLLPFNLESALAGDKVVTRDGREVTQLHLFNITNFTHPLYGVFDKKLASWTQKGFYQSDTHGPSPLDLFMAPKTVKRWVNFHNGQVAYHYDSEARARRGADQRAIAIAVPVEFEEGYGVDHE